MARYNYLVATSKHNKVTVNSNANVFSHVLTFTTEEEEALFDSCKGILDETLKQGKECDIHLLESTLNKVNRIVSAGLWKKLNEKDALAHVTMVETRFPLNLDI